MLKFGNLVVDQLIVPPALWFFFIGGLAAAVVGAGLILQSSSVFRLFGVMNRSVSTRRVLKPLEIPRDSSGLLWKYRRPIAACFAIGAVYSLYGLIAQIDNAAVVTALKLKYPSAAVLLVVESARRLLIIGCAVSLAVAVLLGVFPETMRALEVHASRWVSTRRMAPDADKMNVALDDWVAAFPRAAGCLILVPALGVMFYFGTLLLS
ncbi:MAG: hypothetical protein M0P95_09295 [Sulfuritalea sp.]|jgi:hypothetical protein|nr:hypothetical protein [Sulfuritalea sp.]